MHDEATPAEISAMEAGILSELHRVARAVQRVRSRHGDSPESLELEWACTDLCRTVIEAIRMAQEEG